MDNKQLVSILMPARNTASYIDKCIASIISQTYENWELIIVDDHSEDKTRTIIAGFEIQDSRIICLTNKERGIIPALELAFKKSRGIYITRMDSDDIMPANKLEKFVECISENEKVVVTGKVHYISDEPVSSGYRRYESWLNDLVGDGKHWNFIYRECVIASPNWLVHRNCFLEDFELGALAYPEDYDMVFNWYKAGYSVLGIDEVTHLWREHSERTSRNDSAYQQKSFFNLKTDYFIDLECVDANEIQLIGAGVKGKLVAKTLIKRRQSFKWFDYDSDKYKALIMDQEIHNIADLKSDAKTILTVWPGDLQIQEEITLFLRGKGLTIGQDLYLF